MKHSFFALISRMRFIGRWGLMRNVASENIQEHSTWWPAWPRPGGDPPGRVRHALRRQPLRRRRPLPRRHGDLHRRHAHPIKYHDPAIRDAYKRVESAAESQLMAALPERMRPAYLELLAPEDEYVRKIVRPRTSSPPTSSAWRSAPPATTTLPWLWSRPGRLSWSTACRRWTISWTASGTPSGLPWTNSHKGKGTDIYARHRHRD
jgi:hypothetical protein